MNAPADLYLYHDVFAAAAAVVGSVSLAVSGVVIARINATHRAAEQARDTAVQARDMAAPIGNGYADESRAAWARIEAQLRDLHQRQVKTDAWLVKHLADHARHDMEHDHDQEGTL